MVRPALIFSLLSVLALFAGCGDSTTPSTTPANPAPLEPGNAETAAGPTNVNPSQK